MKTSILILAILVGLAASKSLSYVGTWGVYDGCKTGCCCPTRDSMIRIEDTGTETMELSIVEGHYTSECSSDYGFTDKTKIPLPWDDGTSKTKLDDGVTKDMTKKDSSTVTWKWRPQIGEADQDAPGIKKGDPVALMRVDQGTVINCEFIIGGEIIRLAFGALVLIAMMIVF